MLLFLVACAHHAPDRCSHPRIATIAIPGDPKLVAIARDVLDVRVSLTPNIAAEAGLPDDAVRVPSFAASAVAEDVRRLDADLTALSALPGDLSLHEQVDARWLRANAEEARYRLTTEKRWEHRPAEWLEPVGNTMVAFATVAPDRPELPHALAALVPAMVDEMRREVRAPTRRDVETARGLLDGLVAGFSAAHEDAAAASLKAYGDTLATLADLPEYRVVGPEAYAWRMEHALLLPWTPDALLGLAQGELTRVDAEIATLEARIPPDDPPSDADRAAAEALDQAGLLALYDGVVSENLAKLRAMDALTVPADLPPLRARPTPDALLPFTGDGGSMNPPPLFGAPQPGWWNVEHFDPATPLETRIETVLDARRQATSGMGTYAVHEGVPGHHLQLSIARTNADPIRTILQDTPAVEGWALYAEQLFWEHGGFGPSDAAKRRMLGSYRSRIRRVFYDVNVETRQWNLQEAEDWRESVAAGQGKIGPELLRSIQWPTQLIAYFAGKTQILALREEMRQRQGAAFSERAFHDALLAAGPIPIALVRAEMLGEAPR